jgi:uncharacterized protein YsxB (DUF464 family)
MFDKSFIVCSGISVFVIALLVWFLSIVADASNKRYNELYQECVSENVLSDFECKQAAHYMVYG